MRHSATLAPSDAVRQSSALDAIRLLSFVLLLLTGASAFDPWLIGDASFERSESNPARLLLLLTLYCVFLGSSFVKDADAVVRSVLSDWLAAALVLVPVLSMLWSVDPSTSGRRAVAFALTVLTCKTAAATFSRAELEGALRLFLVVFVVEVYALTLLSPSTAILQGGRMEGAWTGGLAGNTRFARYAAVATLLALSFVITARRKMFDIAVLILSLFALLNSGAKTPLLALIFAVGVYCAVAFFRRLHLPSAFAVVVTAIVALLVLPLGSFFIDEFFGLIERDPTLTHRVVLWDLAVEYAAEQHPLLGSGYRAFWTEAHATPVLYQLFGSYETDFGNGHNGYLDVWLELGLPGVALLAVAVVAFFIGASRAYDFTAGAFSVLSILVFYFAIMYSVAEKFLFEHSETLMIVWLLCLFRSRQTPSP